jgi:putative transposase
MPRQSRNDIAGEVYHVINRANARTWIFETDGDYNAVIEALEETLKKIPFDIFTFCIMSNHWHFAVRPNSDGDMGKFFGKFTQKLTQRWHKYHQSVGSGHLFQGRFKSFLVQTDPYLFN